MTIAQQLKIKKFPFIIKDSDDSIIYYESSDGYWVKYEYDSYGNIIYLESSSNYWIRYEYDSNDNIIYCEDSEFGVLKDNRPKSEIQKAIELLEREGLLVNGKFVKQ